MRKGNNKKLKKGTKSNRFKKMMMSFGTRELIIISFVVVAVIVLFAFKKISTNNNNDEPRFEIEEITAGDGIQNSATNDEDMPVVETATEGMKTESTLDTTILAKKEGAKDGYLNRCVFLGDSRTVAMVNYGLFNDDAALAQIGISHPIFATNKFINNAGKEYTLKSYLASHQAPVIYILLGVNGINDPSETHYKNTFITLIDSVIKMAPNSNVVLVSIGPVDDKGIYKDTVQNALIDKYNDFLLKTAEEKHIFYLNIAEILKGSDGQVKSEYNGGDGLHYSRVGSEAIFKYIVEHPVPGISDEGKYVVKYIKPDPNRLKATMGNESGINEDNLKELVDMMIGASEDQFAATTSDTDTQNSDEAASEGSSFDEEEEEENTESEEESSEAESTGDEEEKSEAEDTKDDETNSEAEDSKEDGKKEDEDSEKREENEENWDSSDEENENVESSDS
jgi:hypothetical protein